MMRWLSSLREMVRGRRERGATLMEAALILPLLLVIGIGLAETGFAVVDWMAVSNATREGTRVGSSAGNDPQADQVILSVVGQASCALHGGKVTRVRIYHADETGGLVGSSQNVYAPTSINCATKTSTWAPVGSLGWPSTSRANKLPTLDHLAVEVTFERKSVTGILPLFQGTFTDTAVMRIEPDTRGS